MSMDKENVMLRHPPDIITKRERKYIKSNIIKGRKKILLSTLRSKPDLTKQTEKGIINLKHSLTNVYTNYTSKGEQ